MADYPDDLQELCAAGQEALMACRYLDAIDLLEEADHRATAAGDLDTLGRLFMPLQEARRQKRQVCGEGRVDLTNVAGSPDDRPDPAALLDEHPHGQFLVAGWGDLAPAVRFRELARERGRYAETFLAAAYPVSGGGRAVAVVPTADVALPPADRDWTPGALQAALPPHALVLNVADLPSPAASGDAATFAATMELWESLHKPFLAAARQTPVSPARIEAYRRVIAVDEAAEFAHQELSETAIELARATARGVSPA